MEIDGVTISWYPPERNGGSAIIDYSIEIQEDGAQWRFIATSINTFAKISNLKKNSTYQFRISARNEIGTSMPYISDEKVTIGKTASECSLYF